MGNIIDAKGGGSRGPEGRCRQPAERYQDLHGGVNTLNSRFDDLVSGSHQLADGAAELADATSGLDTKVIDTIKDKFEGYLNPAFTPTDFVTESTTNGIDRVQFVYMTGRSRTNAFW